MTNEPQAVGAQTVTNLGKGLSKMATEQKDGTAGATDTPESEPGEPSPTGGQEMGTSDPGRHGIGLSESDVAMDTAGEPEDLLGPLTGEAALEVACHESFGRVDAEADELYARISPSSYPDGVDPGRYWLRVHMRYVARECAEQLYPGSLAFHVRLSRGPHGGGAAVVCSPDDAPDCIRIWINVEALERLRAWHSYALLHENAENAFREDMVQRISQAPLEGLGQYDVQEIFVGMPTIDEYRLMYDTAAEKAVEDYPYGFEELLRAALAGVEVEADEEEVPPAATG